MPSPSAGGLTADAHRCPQMVCGLDEPASGRPIVNQGVAGLIPWEAAENSREAAKPRKRWQKWAKRPMDVLEGGVERVGGKMQRGGFEFDRTRIEFDRAGFKVQSTEIKIQGVRSEFQCDESEWERVRSGFECGGD